MFTNNNNKVGNSDKSSNRLWKTQFAQECEGFSNIYPRLRSSLTAYQELGTRLPHFVQFIATNRIGFIYIHIILIRELSARD